MYTTRGPRNGWMFWTYQQRNTSTLSTWKDRGLCGANRMGSSLLANYVLLLNWTEKITKQMSVSVQNPFNINGFPFCRTEHSISWNVFFCYLLCIYVYMFVSPQHQRPTRDFVLHKALLAGLCTSAIQKRFDGYMYKVARKWWQKWPKVQLIILPILYKPLALGCFDIVYSILYILKVPELNQCANTFCIINIHVDGQIHAAE